MNRTEAMIAAKAIDGHLCPGQEEWLYDRAASVSMGSTIVEVGSYRGRSTFCLCAGAEESGAKVVAVTLFRVGDGAFFDESDRTFFHANLGRFLDSGVLTLREGDSAYVLTDMVREGVIADMVFVDAAHEYHPVSVDILNAMFLLKKGGLLAAHDYCDPYSGVIQACNDFRHRLCHLERCGSIYAGRKV